MTEIFIVENGDALRLDVFLAETTGIVRSHIKNLIDDGRVTVDGKTAAKAGLTVKNGNAVAIDIPEPAALDILPEDLPVNIVYQDEYLAVIDKQAGMSVHPSGGIVSGTLVNALLFHLKGLSGINGVQRPGIVHRLDKDTTGLMVVAKTDAAHLSLSRQISEKTAVRNYTALCHGRIKDDSGVIETQIGRDAKDRKKMAVVREGGRSAVTYYSVVKRFLNYTLVSFTLGTGRTHQIRVHSRYIHHPVVGDKTYGQEDKFGLGGQLLHSTKLSFDHPVTGVRMEFESPLPEAFTGVMKRLKPE